MKRTAASPSRVATVAVLGLGRGTGILPVSRSATAAVAAAFALLLLPTLRPPNAFATGAADSSRSGSNPGVYVNEPTLGLAGTVPGGGAAVEFHSAETQHLRVASSTTGIAAFGVALQRFCVEFWFRSTGTGAGGALLGSNATGASTALRILDDDGRFLMRLRSETGRELTLTMSTGCSALLRDGSFHHVAWVVADAANGDATVYVDGLVDAGAAAAGGAAGGFADFTTNFALAASGEDGPVTLCSDAVLDEVALYTNTLTATQVRLRYEAGIGAADRQPDAVEPVTVRDFSGSGNHGMCRNGPLLGVPGATDDGDTAVRFDGLLQYVDVPLETTPIGQFGETLNDFAVEFWYRGSSLGQGKVLMGAVNDGTATAWLVQTGEDGCLNLLLRSQAGNPPMFVRMSPAASVLMRDGRCHHVVWVVADASAGDAAVYVDGERDEGVVVEGAAAGSFASLGHAPAIGAGNERGVVKQHAAAVLDEVALYTYALSEARIQAHYRAALAAGLPTTLLLR